jgi:MFS family permease
LSLREVIKTRQYWFIAVAFFAFCFAMHTVVVHLVRHALDIGLTAVAAAVLVSIWGALSIVGKVAFGGVGDKIGNRKVIIIVFSIWVVGFLGLLLVNQAWMLYLFAAVFGLGYGGFATAQSPVIAEFFGIKYHGQIFGMIFYFGNMGGALGSYLAGSIFDLTGAYTLAFIICAFLSVISIILTLFLRPVRRKAPLDIIDKSLDY